MEEIYISMPRHNGELAARKAYHDFLRTFAIPADTLRPGLPTIKKVIFNPPATIVMWSDNTKTVVKAEKEAFDPEKGLAMAISKKALGNKGNYFNEIKKHVTKDAQLEAAAYNISAGIKEGFKRAKAGIDALADRMKKGSGNRFSACKIG